MSWALVSYEVGAKEVMTTADGAATGTAGTPPDLRSAPVLSPARAAELARTGLAIESSTASRWTSGGRSPRVPLPR